MSYQVQDSPFFAPSSIEYRDAAGIPIPDANEVASTILISWASLRQDVSFNADGKPLVASVGYKEGA